MGIWQALLTLAGEKETVGFFRSQAEAHWIRNNQPDIWERTAKYLLLSGYLTYKLTGKYVDSVASQVGYLPFDFKRHKWAGALDWKWQALPIKRQQLPDLVPAGSPLGVINEEAAEQTGIPVGLPLISAGADKACEVLASGCLSPDTGSLSYGTTALITARIPDTSNPSNMYPPIPRPCPMRTTPKLSCNAGTGW